MPSEREVLLEYGANAKGSARVIQTPEGVAIEMDGDKPNLIAVHEYEQRVKEE
ncbi:hypothetical protein [Streptomyces sp. S186]|uniref:hypothetical protein n=1 Tax=Streptomyces sp. S186 TaxID=3434395 RepID=UPI003F664346